MSRKTRKLQFQRELTAARENSPGERNSRVSEEEETIQVFWGKMIRAKIPDEVRGRRRRRAARCWRSRRLPKTARPATEPPLILALSFILHL